MKRTKVLATISDGNCEPSFLRQLYNAGMNAVRLNTAHMSLEGALNIIRNVRSVSESIGILIDTKGPEIRLTDVSSPLKFAKGKTVLVSWDNNALSTISHLYVSYQHFVKEVPLGSRILIADGLLELTVKSKSKDALTCVVENDCTITGKKGVSVPGASLQIPALSLKDLQFLKLAAKEKVDFIAHSFVRNKKDVLALRKLLEKMSYQPKLIAKIENQQGVNNIDEILNVVDGIMVARGDLAVEIPAEEVPVVQKMLIQKCIEHAKFVITATQMLHSMIENPRPTRAEVSDVANAIYDGTDAVMLSGETAQGKYPVKAVQLMARIAERIEEEKKHVLTTHQLAVSPSTTTHLVKSAMEASLRLPVKAVVVATTSGFSARLAARFRAYSPIIAKCYLQSTVRELSLVYGIFPSRIHSPKKNHEVVPMILQSLQKDDGLRKDDLIVLLTGIPGKIGITTSVSMLTISDAIEKFMKSIEKNA